MTRPTERARSFSPTVFLLSVSLVLFGLFGCDSAVTEPPPDLAEKLFKGEVAVGFPDDPAVPVLAADINKEKLGVFGPDGSGAAGGIAYTTSEGRHMVVFLDDRGLPARAIIEDVAFVFAGYDGSTIDIAAVMPDGSDYYEEDVRIEEGFAASIRLGRSGITALASLSASSPDFISALRNLSSTASAVGCAIAVAGGTIGGGVPGAVAVASCGATLLESLAEIYEVDKPALLRSQEAYEFSFFADTAGCVGKSGADCISLLSNLFADAFERGEEILKERKDDISRAKKTLETGGGDKGDDDDGDSTSQLIRNGGFESGEDGWRMRNAVVSDGDYAHRGSRYVVMGRRNSTYYYLRQVVTIPENVESAKLLFWLNFTSSDTDGGDNLVVTVEKPDGTPLDRGLIGTYGANDADSAPGNYRKIPFDATRYRGQTVQVEFLVTTDESAPTIYRIDDVSLVITYR